MKETHVRLPQWNITLAQMRGFLATDRHAGLIMTLRSEIITCIPTSAAILHLNEQLLSGPLSLMVSLCNLIQQIEFYCYQLLFFPTNPVFRSLFLRFPALPPKDTTVSGSKTWQWFGFSKAMSHAGLFSPQWASERSICPHMCLVGPALPTLLIAGDVLDLVQLTSKETRYIIVRRGTTGDQTEDGFVEPLNASTKRFGHKRLSCLAWSQSMGFSHYNRKQETLDMLHRQAPML